MKPAIMTEAQLKVLEGARARLKRKPWYKGVCLDNFPTDAECIKDEDESIRTVFAETELWDKP